MYPDSPNHKASAPGNIILSGEYAVVFGYPGIAIPSSMRTNVMWIEDASPLRIENAHGDTLPGKIAGLCAAIMGRECGGTLTIDSDIPVGRGMGSSTALVIAIARCLLGSDCMKHALAIEDVLNPGHSGLDFAVIWDNTPVVFQKEKKLRALSTMSYSLKSFSLIDSGMPNERTPELVAWVALRRAQGDTSVIKALEVIGHCTERLLAGESLATVIPDHHAAQVALGVVPEKAQVMIKKIVQVFGPAKVIGAGGRTGGGGMIFALGTDHKALEAALGPV